MSSPGTSPTFLLTGATGQLGWELRRTLAPLGPVIAPARAELDLAEPDGIRAALQHHHPSVIVNAAAYTAVDRAEAEAELAHAINAAAPVILAEEAARSGALLVHFSTDYVFDGAAERPYREADRPNPLNVYGRSKRAGERAIEEVGGTHLIFRTSWVYGMRGSNFLRSMLRLAREREEMRVVDDQIGAPTWSRMIAEATALVLAQIAGAGWELPSDAGGVYHLTAGGETNWYGFAQAILERDPAREEQRCRTLRPIPTSEYPTPAARPRFSVLDNQRIAERFGIRLPHWRTQLELAMP